jgi:hypothetical protein
MGSLHHWRVHPQCLLGVDDPPHTCSCSVFLLLPSYPLFPAFLILVFESRFCYVLLPFSHVILFTTLLWDEVDWFLHSRSYLSSFTRFALTLPLYLSVLNDHHFPAQMYSYSVYQLLRNIVLGCARLMLRSSSGPSSRNRSSQMEWQVFFVYGLSSLPCTVHPLTLTASSCHWSCPSICLFVST